ncbi:hypothetical protein [Candidatus Chlorohelix sp.]|uniref:hypothetical protein n=1 Tax=Candidatus Chlorohelix sp. TaxID=3139201 RepID=UPI00303AC97F
MSAKILWLVLIIWLGLFLLIRETFKIGLNPALTFIFLVILFFLVLFTVRISVFKLRLWWGKFSVKFKRLFPPR